MVNSCPPSGSMMELTSSASDCDTFHVLSSREFFDSVIKHSDLGFFGSIMCKNDTSSPPYGWNCTTMLRVVRSQRTTRPSLPVINARSSDTNTASAMSPSPHGSTSTGSDAITDTTFGAAPTYGSRLSTLDASASGSFSSAPNTVAALSRVASSCSSLGSSISCSTGTLIARDADSVATARVESPSATSSSPSSSSSEDSENTDEEDADEADSSSPSSAASSPKPTFAATGAAAGAPSTGAFL
mmetsp:Transcript_7704/g.16462  ORF Transcript_7704/g.16462 Transcript_7704/m.16462 type:complete len:243 (-) Transcript_7704:997-1725(-)